MVDVITGMASLTSLGLPEVLLWVLTFAVTFGVLVELKIFKRAPATLISIVIAFLVLMAAPASVISVLETMSTTLILVSIGVLVLMSLLFAGKVGGIYSKLSWLVELVLIAIVALAFVGAGGLALIGITLPSLAWLGSIPWVLVVIGLAVLWMLYESREPAPKPAPAQTKG